MLTGSVTTRPGRIRAGQRMIAGTRTPPSSQEPLPPLKGPAEPGGDDRPVVAREDHERILVDSERAQRGHQRPHRCVELLDHVAVGARARTAGELGSGLVVEVRVAVGEIHEERAVAAVPR